VDLLAHRISFLSFWLEILWKHDANETQNNKRARYDFPHTVVIVLLCDVLLSNNTILVLQLSVSMQCQFNNVILNYKNVKRANPSFKSSIGASKACASVQRVVLRIAKIDAVVAYGHRVHLNRSTWRQTVKIRVLRPYCCEVELTSVNL